MTSTTNAKYCMDSDESESSQRVQFHGQYITFTPVDLLTNREPAVIGTKDFISPKFQRKRPSNAFVGMRVLGDSPNDKAYLSTSVVKCKNADEPEWYDNLGPMWLSPFSTISFHVKTRSKFSKTTAILASTETYTLKKLRKMQGHMDRQSTIALPLRSHNPHTDLPTGGLLIINLRELSTSKSAMEEYMSLRSAGSQRSSLEDGSLKTQEGASPLSPVSGESRTLP
ncbi:hypothetical protein EV368DRAFT_79974 [Lentinula lateritia]|nr:hypothetical protein EV368DRAFT_79974 [Lentinula lateritia]